MRLHLDSAVTDPFDLGIPDAGRALEHMLADDGVPSFGNVLVDFVNAGSPR
jgi:hypothetical protein